MMSSIAANEMENVCLLVCFTRVGIQLPTIEVRYENVCVEAECYVGDRALPTLVNAARNALEVTLNPKPNSPFSLSLSLCVSVSVFSTQVPGLVVVVVVLVVGGGGGGGGG
jgi:hypothetical protein